MDGTPTPRSPETSRWIGCELVMAQALARFCADGVDTDEYKHFRVMFDESAMLRYQEPADIARFTGGLLEFDADAPWDGWYCDPRCRLSMEGHDPMIFEEVAAYYAWAKANLLMLKARNERECFARSTPALTKSANRPKRPGL